MTGGQFMVVLIVAIVMFSSIIKAKRGIRHRKYGPHGERGYSVRDDAAVSAENHRLKGEIADLRERIQVLERVVTDNEGSLRLDREIEKLRGPREN
ncbi:hypothetical protein SAMN06297144_2780 [Sphingomonas guangdongensis]|uniref:Phage shock protein B n=1 Tax=Sphingomonas guangdongensis TaxID=1141890 RepID=A0A285R1E6_9SPHN|nr:hypothetical protein [Sphingomonas guangdongensis]SOB87644.1 hypothetical protein SAMN06297144_2780 [Sphingomonas guangdongensis]